MAQYKLNKPILAMLQCLRLIIMIKSNHKSPKLRGGDVVWALSPIGIWMLGFRGHEFAELPAASQPGCEIALAFGYLQQFLVRLVPVVSQQLALASVSRWG